MGTLTKQQVEINAIKDLLIELTRMIVTQERKVIGVSQNVLRLEYLIRRIESLQ